MRNIEVKPKYHRSLQEPLTLSMVCSRNTSKVWYGRNSDFGRLPRLKFRTQYQSNLRCVGLRTTAKFQSTKSRKSGLFCRQLATLICINKDTIELKICFRRDRSCRATRHTKTRTQGVTIA
jgi:hypothetical protein